MTIQVYPEPQSDPTSNVAGASWVTNVYSNINEAIDVAIVNRTLIPLTTPASVVPGVYEYYQTSTTAGGWSVMYPDNSTNNITYNTASLTGVIKVNTSGTLYAQAPTVWVYNSSTPFNGAGYLGQPHYANGYIAIPASLGNGATNTPRIKVTTDGSSYTEYNPAMVDSSSYYPTAITYLNNANRWVVGGNSGYITSSTDLINWSTGQATNVIISMASNGVNRVSAVTNQSPALYYTSTNGLNWTTRTTGIPAQAQRLKYENGIWYILNGQSGFNPTLVTSTDGINWNSVATGTFPVSDVTTDVAYGNGRYVMVSEFGNVNWSTDGFNWSTTGNLERRTDNSGRRFFTSVFNDGRFVIAGKSTNATSQRVWTSTDASNWTDITTAATSGAATTSTSIFYSVAVPTTELGFPNSTWVLWGAADAGTGVWTTRNITSPQQTQSRKIKGRLAVAAQTQTLTKKSNLNLNYTTTVA